MKHNAFDRRHTYLATLFIETLSGELAKFIAKIHNEKGWWYRVSLKPNAVAHEADNIMPSVGKLFSLPDKAMNVIFTKTGICKHAKDHVCQMNCKGIEEFKGQRSSMTKTLK